MVLTACCGLLLRSGFLAVAAPLLLVGGLLSQVSVELELQSLRSLEFAVLQETVAAAAQEEAAKNVGVAALDQAEADELTADAAALQGAAAGEEADATAHEAEGVGEVDATAAGEASAAEAETSASEGMQSASDVASQVEQVSSAIMDALGEAGGAASASADAVGDAAAAELGAAGATAAETAAADAAAEAVAAGAAGTATAPAVAPAVALGGAAAAIATEGPQVVAAAQEQWAAGSAEIRAAGDESLATEKGAQAGALEASVPVLEGSAVTAHEAAVTGALAGVGYLTAAAASQLLALAAQTPVACVVLTQWLCGAGAGTLGTFAAIWGACVKSTKVAPMADGFAESDAGALAAALAAKSALAAALASLMLGSWAEVVTTAAKLEEAGDFVLSKLSVLPSLAEKAAPLLDRATSLEGNSSRRLSESQSPRDAWGSLADWAGKTAQKVEGTSNVVLSEGVNSLKSRGGELVQDQEAKLLKGSKGLLEQSQAAAEKVEGASKVALSEGVKSLRSKGGELLQDQEANLLRGGQAAERAVPGIVNTTAGLLAQGKKTADKAIQDASRNAREQAVNVAKRIVVKAPNTETTTIAPLYVPKPPTTLGYSHFLAPGFDRLKQSALHWILPIVLDLVLISCAFVAFELVVGIGRHLPAYRGGASGACDIARQLLSDVGSGWVWGTAVLVAFWLLGILFAKELRGIAERIQASPLHPVVPASLCLLSAGACVSHAVLLSRLEPKTAQEEEEDVALSTNSAESAEPLLPSSEAEVPKVSSQRALAVMLVAEYILAALIGLTGALVSAVEGPLFTLAVGGSYKSLLTSGWLLGLVPWEHLAPKILGQKLPLVVVLGSIASLAVLLGAALFLAKRAASQTAK